MAPIFVNFYISKITYKVGSYDWVISKLVQFIQTYKFSNRNQVVVHYENGSERFEHAEKSDRVAAKSTHCRFRSSSPSSFWLRVEWCAGIRATSAHLGFECIGLRFFRKRSSPASPKKRSGQNPPEDDGHSGNFPVSISPGNASRCLCLSCPTTYKLL